MSVRHWELLTGFGPYGRHIYRVLVEQEGQRQTRIVSIEGKVQTFRRDRGSMPRLAGLAPVDHRGHLIAFRFGGPNSRLNLIPMHGLINMSGGPWYRMEDEIAEFLGTRPGEMAVHVQYETADVMRPRAFDVRVVNWGGEVRLYRHYNFNPHLPNPHRV